MANGGGDPAIPYSQAVMSFVVESNVHRVILPLPVLVMKA